MLALPTDLALVKAAAATYDPAAIPDFVDINKAIRVFVTKRDDGLQIIAIEGTHSPIGWALDFIAAATEDQQGMNHATLGFIHAGFYGAALTALTRCSLVAAAGPYAICGHSLGAALALLIGGLLSQDELNGRSLAPVKIGAFAPPKVGGAQFIKAISAIPFCAYRYGNDIVPTVPLTVRPWLPYEQIPLIELSDTNMPRLGVFQSHHIDNYVAGVTALCAGKSES